MHYQSCRMIHTKTKRIQGEIQVFWYTQLNTNKTLVVVKIEKKLILQTWS